MLRNRVTTRHLLATRMRSWFRMSLLTAATISGVSPGASCAEHLARRFVAQQPVAKLADGQVGNRRERGRVVRVDDQPRDFVVFVGNERLVEKRASGTSASAICAATRSSSFSAAMPASASPLRAGDAFASSVFKLVEAVRLFADGGAESSHGTASPQVRRSAVGGFVRHSGTSTAAENSKPTRKTSNNGVQSLFGRDHSRQVSAQNAADRADAVDESGRRAGAALRAEVDRGGAEIIESGPNRNTPTKKKNARHHPDVVDLRQTERA